MPSALSGKPAIQNIAACTNGNKKRRCHDSEDRVAFCVSNSTTTAHHNIKGLACSIQALLSAPNPDDPLAEAIAKHWKENEPEAIATGEKLIID